MYVTGKFRLNGTEKRFGISTSYVRASRVMQVQIECVRWIIQLVDNFWETKKGNNRNSGLCRKYSYYQLQL